MYFLKYGAVLNNVGQDNKLKKEYKSKEFAQTIAIHTTDYNTEHQNAWFFVKNITDFSITIGAIVNKKKRQKDFEDFIKVLGLSVKNIICEEITFAQTLDMLHNAYRKDYINDDDFIGQFKLKTPKYMLDNLFYENIFEITPKSSTLQYAKNVLNSDSLIEELNRTYSCKKIRSICGHPVHYIVEIDDKKQSKDAIRTLIQSLYNQGRVINQRYCVMNITQYAKNFENEIDSVYKMNKGGTIVVSLENNNTNNNKIANNHLKIPSYSILKNFCTVMKNYRNDVLTIFDFPSECQTYKKELSEYYDDITFIEIKETLFFGNDAIKFLDRLAKKDRISADKLLYNKIDNKLGYYAYELKKIFNVWYSENLKTSVFPVYNNIESDVNIKKTIKPKGSAYDELNKMIGLGGAKKVIKQAIDYNNVQDLLVKQNLSSNKLSMHMIFTGNPGTAKTSCARLFARIMKENGIISKGHIVEVGRADLVGRYIGWTAQMVKEKFKEANGGVLFIDEAYSLAKEKEGDFGQEAIDTIVQEMENNRDNVVTIFAGYPKEMKKFLDQNPGLRSRIAFHIHFDDYSTKELGEIARLIAEKRDLIFQMKHTKNLKNILKRQD